jgi:UDP-N-acetyl-D-glucosamine dehydrogenase
MRESPAVKLMEILRAKGASIFYSDPYFDEFPKMREHHFNLKSVKVTEALLAEMDCVLIATDHDVFDYEFI